MKHNDKERNAAMGNILQNSLDVTYEDFLRGVFGDVHYPPPCALRRKRVQ